MLTSYLWLKDWIDHNLAPQELADALTSLGLETRVIDDRRGKFANIVVGKVLSRKPHPDADKLSATEVDAGDGRKLSIVCGAPNVAEGQSVAVALVGAVLPDGLKIEKRKLRGVLSEGMICSERELALSDESDGILVLEGAPKPGTPINEFLEVEDAILEIDLTPDRGDCLSLLGVAREIAALTGNKIKIPLDELPKGKPVEGLKVEIKNEANSPRYTASGINGVKVAPSPLRIRRRLNAVGIRPINNIVDATNYIMMETGHPLHAFDRRDIAKGSIIVRNANEGEKFETLDGRKHTLNGKDLLIADAERGIALAGIMGGLNSEIKGDTSDVILEAAFFNPVSTRVTSRRLGLSTDSSYRFERGVNPDSVPFANARATAMICELGGGKASGYTDICAVKNEPRSVRVRTERINSILGVALKESEISSLFKRLAFDFESKGSEFTVKIPPFRHDISEEADFIEEVARLYGYDNIKATSPRLSQHDADGHSGYRDRRELNRLLSASGLHETINYSFINSEWRKSFFGADDPGKREPILLKNPINADWAELRTSLLPGLMNRAAFNIRHGEENVSIYETGAVFHPGDKGAVSEEFLCSGVMTAGSAGTEEIFGTNVPRDFFRLKGIIENVIGTSRGERPVFKRPSKPRGWLYDHRQLDIIFAGKTIGFMGQVHTLSSEPFEIDLDICCFEFSVNGLLELPVKETKTRNLARFPGIKRDIALVVDEKEEVGGIVGTILETDSDRIKSCRLFDLYRGKQVEEGKKSLAFRLLFVDESATLTDEAGDKIVQEIMERLKEKHNAELRG
ncbi:MAG: phenylalanine--tRNA ligase subunit beta [Nitrospinota bacterium]|nr:phenylalanine--tRNA ligase subunit beta [Nitrospinota bacterium]